MDTTEQPNRTVRRRTLGAFALALAVGLGLVAAGCGSDGGSSATGAKTSSTTAGPRTRYTGDADSRFCRQVRTVDRTVESLEGKKPGDVERQVQRQLVVQLPLADLAPPEVKADVETYVRTELHQRDLLVANGWDFSKLTQADRLVSTADAQALERVARYAADVCGVHNGR